MSRDYLITADALGLHAILFKSCCGLPVLGIWRGGVRLSTSMPLLRR